MGSRARGGGSGGPVRRPGRWGSGCATCRVGLALAIRIRRGMSPKCLFLEWLKMKFPLRPTSCQKLEIGQLLQCTFLWELPDLKKASTAELVLLFTHTSLITFPTTRHRDVLRNIHGWRGVFLALHAASCRRVKTMPIILVHSFWVAHI